MPVRGHNGECTHIRREPRQGVAAAIQQHRLSRESLCQDAVRGGRYSTATIQEGRRGTSYLVSGIWECERST